MPVPNQDIFDNNQTLPARDLQMADRAALGEVEDLFKNLPGALNRWDYRNAKLPTRPDFAELTADALKLIGVSSEGNPKNELINIASGILEVPPISGGRTLAIASSYKQLVAACGGPADACVTPDRIVVPTKAAQDGLTEALGKFSSKQAEQDVSSTAKLFSLEPNVFTDPTLRGIYLRSVLIHELTHDSTATLNGQPSMLTMASEWRCYWAQGKYLAQNLGTPKPVDAEILRHIARGQTLGIAYARSVMDCFSDKDPSERAKWLPGGLEFEKLREELTSRNDESQSDQEKVIGRQNSSAPFLKTQIGGQFIAGINQHYIVDSLRTLGADKLVGARKVAQIRTRQLLNSE